jgi:hypothetical protein
VELEEIVGDFDLFYDPAYNPWENQDVENGISDGTIQAGEPYGADTVDIAPPNVGEQNWLLVGIGTFFSNAWEAVKLWDNSDVAANYNNLRDADGGLVASGLTAFAASVGEQIGVGKLVDAVSGRTASGETLGALGRVWNGLLGTGEVALNAVGLKGAGQAAKTLVNEGVNIIQAGIQKIPGKLSDLVGLVGGKGAKKPVKATAPRTVGVEQVPELHISASQYPELAENIRHAQAAGHPSVLTHGGDINANRAAALKDVPRVAGLSRDEYPFASALEGGAGAWVGHVPGRQQNAQGGFLAKFLRDHNIVPGDRYKVILNP